jgi:hypothetical protein
MPRRTVVLNTGESVVVNVDDPPPLAARWWGIVRARVLDVVTNEPVRSLIQIEAQEAGLHPRVAQGGLVGMVGIPLLLFPALAAQGYNLHVTIRAEGYLAHSATVPIPAQPGFPGSFTPADMGDVVMFR